MRNSIALKRFYKINTALLSKKRKKKLLWHCYSLLTQFKSNLIFQNHAWTKSIDLKLGHGNILYIPRFVHLLTVL